VPCTFTGEKRRSADAFFERFERILGLERKRAAAFGVELLAGLSVNAADIGDVDAAWQVLDALPRYLEREGVAAVGELSLKSFSEEERALFARQLEIAEAAGVPAMVEVPPGSGEEMAAALGRAIQESHVRPENIIAVDVNSEKLPAFWELGLGAYGLPVSPPNNGLFAIHRKVDAVEARALLDQYGPERLMFNTALHLGSGDPLGISRVLLHLQRSGVSDEVLRRLAYGNAMQFFSPSSRRGIEGAVA
jgi:uncharacterized protein